jgi:hypothetical protein
MLDRLSRLPRRYFVVALVLSAALFVASAVLYFRLDINDTPVESLPREYWLVLVLMLLSAVSIWTSMYCLSSTRIRALAESMVGLGIGCLIWFLLEIGRGGWTGSTITSAVGTGVFFLFALAFSLLERRSSTTALARPSNSKST